MINNSELSSLSEAVALKKPRTKKIGSSITVSDFLRQWAKSEGVCLSKLAEEILWHKFRMHLIELPIDERATILKGLGQTEIQENRGRHNKDKPGFGQRLAAA